MRMHVHAPEQTENGITRTIVVNEITISIHMHFGNVSLGCLIHVIMDINPCSPINERIFTFTIISAEYSSGSNPTMHHCADANP